MADRFINMLFCVRFICYCFLFWFSFEQLVSSIQVHAVEHDWGSWRRCHSGNWDGIMNANFVVNFRNIGCGPTPPMQSWWNSWGFAATRRALQATGFSSIYHSAEKLYDQFLLRWRKNRFLLDIASEIYLLVRHIKVTITGLFTDVDSWIDEKAFENGRYTEKSQMIIVMVVSWIGIFDAAGQ